MHSPVCIYAQYWVQCQLGNQCCLSAFATNLRPHNITLALKIYVPLLKANHTLSGHHSSLHPNCKYRIQLKYNEYFNPKTLLMSRLTSFWQVPGYRNFSNPESPREELFSLILHNTVWVKFSMSDVTVRCQAWVQLTSIVALLVHCNILMIGYKWLHHLSNIQFLNVFPGIHVGPYMYFLCSKYIEMRRCTEPGGLYGWWVLAFLYSWKK